MGLFATGRAVPRCVFATRRRSEKEGGRQSWDIQGCKTAAVRGGKQKALKAVG